MLGMVWRRFVVGEDTAFAPLWKGASAAVGTS